MNNARFGANEPRPQPSSPAAAQTPQEALTYIDRLYKAGRTDQLAAILRRSKVFREAWLILQRSFVDHPGIAAEPGPAKLAAASASEDIPAALTPPQSVHGPHPAGSFACTPAQAHKVYRSQLNFYDQERNPTSRLSLRV